MSSPAVTVTAPACTVGEPNDGETDSAPGSTVVENTTAGDNNPGETDSNGAATVTGASTDGL